MPYEPTDVTEYLPVLIFVLAIAATIVMSVYPERPER
jgi:hypothetical protein